jgi:hypothetical protein
MTSFVAWAGIDNRAMASVYFASDSRLTGTLKYDSATGKTLGTWHWDYGRKLFASRCYPDIFGYVGDVLFPSQILGQMVDLIDSGVLFGSDDRPEDKLEKMIGFFDQASQGYPYMQDVKIIYCSRLDFEHTASLRSTFRVFSLTRGNHEWKIKRWGMPGKSGEILVDGSGKNYIKVALRKWGESQHKETSRSIFSAFCDGLESITDPNSGGAPQLVGVQRKGTGKYFGIIYKGQSYFLGLPFKRPQNPERIQWFNELFEIANGKKQKRQQTAQKHEDI